MGYYTRYDLQTEPQDYEIINHLRIFCYDASFAIDKDGDFNQEVKWYYADRDLKEFSLLHPNTLFILSGEGEDNEDIWKLYVKNGKAKKYKAVIYFPEYKESELT